MGNCNETQTAPGEDRHLLHPEQQRHNGGAGGAGGADQQRSTLFAAKPIEERPVDLSATGPLRAANAQSRSQQQLNEETEALRVARVKLGEREQSLRELRAQLKLERSQLNEERAALMQRIAAQKTTSEQLTERSAQVDRQNAKLSVSAQQLLDERASLEISALEARCVELNAQLEAERRRVANVQSKCQKQQEEIRVMEESVQFMEEELAQTTALHEKELERLQCELDAKSRIVKEEPQATNSNTQQLVIAVRAATQKFAQQRNDARVQLESTLTRLAEAEMERDLSLKKVEQYQSRIDSMHDERVRDTEHMVAEMQRLFHEVEDHQRQSTQLGEALRISEQKREEALSEVVALQEGLERLQSVGSSSTSPSSQTATSLPTQPAVCDPDHTVVNTTGRPSSTSSKQPGSSSSTPTSASPTATTASSSSAAATSSSAAATSSSSAAAPSSSSSGTASPSTETIFDEDELPEEEDDPDLARALVASELVKVEQHYVRDLKLIVDAFVKPLRDLQVRAEDSGNEAVLPITCHQEIFSSLEIILKHHLLFYEQLELRILGEWRSQQPQTRIVGDILQSLVQHLTGYSAYISNYSHAVATIRKCTKAYPLFRDFIRSPTVRKQCGAFSLADYLILPIQQIPRYVLLVKELLSKTSKSHQDRASLETALRDIQTVANRINEQMHESENGRKVLQVQCQLVGAKVPTLLEPCRRWVREDALALLKGKTTISRYYFLFNDLLVETKEKKAPRKGRKKSSTTDGESVVYSYKRTFPLQYLHVSSSESEPTRIDLSFGKNSKGRKQFSLLASNEKQAEEWVDLLRSQIVKAQQHGSALSALEARVTNRLSSFAFKSLPDLRADGVKLVDRKTS
eukprot:CAMPEP_0177680748 /NCGR_PEP_ID=MMETSP0447-20121125/30341_1 /TAXON_ID=0 /ORGANISM="Stygamoeba regulata, Strain BSH-02190019" /LENGTH=863 /DNA_ID=CAMNT_0019190105 /DNA_START=88 /DNA_END=2678 /DNA_ORIENTATION=-